ncbi:diguanylate cyclase [Marinobacter lacisalsi]|uniref:diguanylate cyclase n=1 Tax=Marinobacter lacisalsi TaxID=475979 RepID=A0ABV8QER7_9GAMM
MRLSATDIQASLAALRDRFLVRAREEVLYLSQQAEKMRRVGLTEAELSEAYSLLHRLAGSAGTFGLADLGEAARSLEKSLKPYLEDDEQGGCAGSVREALEPMFVSGVMALSELLRDQQTPAAPLDQPSADAGIVSQGMQVRVLVCQEQARVSRDLVDGLALYGFQCIQVSVASSSLERWIKESSRVASVCVVDDEQLEQVAAECRRLGVTGRQLPLLCLSRDDSFEKRYWAAATGAEGFFAEPLDFPRLADSVERLVSERKQPASGRVLMVEDDPDLAEHYRLVLESAGVVVRLVQSFRNLIGELADFRPDIVLMDVQLEGMSGITLARLIRFEPRWLSLPIVYLSSEDDPENQLAAMSEGADEFLVKPVSDGYLVRSVLLRCRRARQLSELMNRDSLTGLFKHALIKQQAQMELANCRRLGHSSSVAMIDLDHFKQVNDTWGHGCGDKVIKALSNLLKNRLRETDVIGRYGGEEFLVVLPGCDAGQARRVIEDIGRSFAELSFFGTNDESFSVTLSAGVASLNDFTHGDEALEAADQALYQQKRAGRNGVTVFSPQQGAGQEEP